ncbi:MAG: hypothetical protein ACREQI_06435, partial [Candidatus Binataceae bacterium]
MKSSAWKVFGIAAIAAIAIAAGASLLAVHARASLRSHAAAAVQNLTPLPPSHEWEGGSAAATARVTSLLGRLPLTFEANRGQTDARVKFLARGEGYTLFLTRTGATLALRSSAS